MLQAKSMCAVLLLALSLSVEGRLLGSPGKATAVGEHKALVTPLSHSQAPESAKPASKPVAKPAVAKPAVAKPAVAKPAVAKPAVAKPATVAAHTNHSAKAQGQPAKKNLTEIEQLANFKMALQTITNLQADFTAGQDSSGDAKGMQQLAEGAMTTELHKKDSKFWGSIQQMLKETTGAMSKMTNATASGRKNILHDLESSINASADTLKNVTENAGKKQEQQSDEYLVGLLNQHRNEWSMEKQLNVTKKFSSNSPAAQELLKHHNTKEPLAAQLARLMDSAPSSSKSKVKKAAKLFLQLEDMIQGMQA